MVVKPQEEPLLFYGLSFTSADYIQVLPEPCWIITHHTTLKPNLGKKSKSALSFALPAAVVRISKVTTVGTVAAWSHPRAHFLFVFLMVDLGSFHCAIRYYELSVPRI
jgi:hypothetical protein